MVLPRWKDLIPEEHPGSADHVQRCPDCRGKLETERRYLASLRQAEVPRASHSLHERLLAHTEYLAAQAEDAERARGRGRSRGAARAGLSALVGAAACAAALAVTAYAVAGEPQHRPAPGNGAAALIRTTTGSDLPSRLAPGTSAQLASHAEEPLDRLGRGLRMVFGASGRP